MFQADKLIFAGNALLAGLVPAIRPYQMPVGTYMIATEPMDPGRAAATLPSDAAIGDWLFALVLSDERGQADAVGGARFLFPPCPRVH